MSRHAVLRAACEVLALMLALDVSALECPKIPDQARKDWEVEVRTAVGKIGPAKGAELETLTRSTTRDLAGKLPQADKVYLEQMMYATYCSALRDDPSLSESEKSARIRAYNTEVRNTLRAVTAKGAPDNSVKEAALLQLKRIPLPYTADAFVESAGKGDLAAVRLFLAAGMEPDVKDESFQTAIAQAVAEGHLDVVQALLKSGASKVVALNSAAENDRSEIVRYLLDHGASKDAINDAFLSAARAGSLEALQTLVKRGADRSRANDALILAAQGMRDLSQEQRTRVISLLLELGADVNAKNKYGWNALHSASNDALALNVQALLDAGADVNMICECKGFLDWGGDMTSLLIALAGTGESMNKPVVVDILLARGADPNIASKNGRTALMAAVDHSLNVDVVKALLAKGANVNATNPKGESVLMLSVRSAETIEVLAKNHADVNAREKKNGSTALMWAAGDGKPASVEALLDAGADIHAKNKFGRTALMLAVREGHPDAVRALLKRGAKVDDQDEDGKSVLNYAEEDLKGQDSINMVRLLKKAGAK